MNENTSKNGKIRLSIRLLIYIGVLVVGVAVAFGGYKVSFQYLMSTVTNNTAGIEKNRELSENNKERVGQVETHIKYIHRDIAKILTILEKINE